MGRQGSHTQFYAFHGSTVTRETQIVHQTRILAIVKKFPSVPKRIVYFRENRREKIRWPSWPDPKVSLKVQFDNRYIF